MNFEFLRVREVAAGVKDFPFVFRTDVKGYYRSINHDLLYDLVANYVDEPEVLGLVEQYSATRYG